jgi:hypothetical protein
VASEVPVPKRVHVDFTDSSDCDESSTVNTPRLKYLSRAQSESDVSNFSIADSSESDEEDSKSSDSAILDDKMDPFTSMK